MNDDTLFSIFDETDNVYNTCPLRGDLRPEALARKERATASTGAYTPRSRRKSYLAAASL